MGDAFLEDLQRTDGTVEFSHVVHMISGVQIVPAKQTASFEVFLDLCSSFVAAKQHTGLVLRCHFPAPTFTAYNFALHATRATGT